MFEFVSVEIPQINLSNTCMLDDALFGYISTSILFQDIVDGMKSSIYSSSRSLHQTRFDGKEIKNAHNNSKYHMI